MDQDCFDMEYEGSRILADTKIAGHIKSDKDICLDGVIEGNVRSSGQVIVNKGGIIDGDVECEALFINGKITGNVCVARKTVMGANAQIGGRLITATLEIHPAAEIRNGLKLKSASK